MDERLEKALKFSKYRETIENRRVALKRRYDEMITIHYRNGVFKADNKTIGFVFGLIQDGLTSAILLDIKHKPIEIDNLVEFKELLVNIYSTATSEYLSEIKNLNAARDINKIMDW